MVIESLKGVFEAWAKWSERGERKKERTADLLDAAASEAEALFLGVRTLVAYSLRRERKRGARPEDNPDLEVGMLIHSRCKLLMHLYAECSAVIGDSPTSTRLQHILGLMHQSPHGFHAAMSFARGAGLANKDSKQSVALRRAAEEIGEHVAELKAFAVIYRASI